MNTTLYHALLLAGLALAAAWTWRRPGWPRFLAGAAVVAALALVLARALTLPLGHGPFATLRLLAWAVFVYLPLGLGLGAWLLRRRGRAPWLLGSLAAAVVAVGVDAFWVEPRWLEVGTVRLASSRLERPLRIVLVADLQTDEPGEYELDALRRAAALEPDLLLFAGDYVQEPDPVASARLRRELRRLVLAAGLRARLGAFAVRGDAELDGWEDLFAGTPVQAFDRSARLDLGEVVLTLLSPGASRGEGLAVVPDERRFHVVVGHAPDYALEPVPADLLLAGHTHGGQVRLPLFGPPITLSRVPRAWAAGVTPLPDGRTLVVSRGVGMERGPAPRLRFLCRPELVVIDVEPGATGRLLATTSTGALTPK